MISHVDAKEAHQASFGTSRHYLFGKGRRKRPPWREEAANADMESWRLAGGAGS